MKLTILKSEDILFHAQSGERILASKTIDLDKISTIEGVSEYSVLQLEYKGNTYLLTEEFKVEASLESLDEFLEEYDEEDDEELEEGEEDEFNALVDEKEFEDELDEEFSVKILKLEEEKQELDKQNEENTLLEEDYEAQKEELYTSSSFYQQEDRAVIGENIEIISDFSSTVEVITAVEHTEPQEENSNQEEMTLEHDSTLLTQLQTLIENNIIQTNRVDTLIDVEEIPLELNTVVEVEETESEEVNLNPEENVIEDSLVVEDSTPVEEPELEPAPVPEPVPIPVPIPEPVLDTSEADALARMETASLIEGDLSLLEINNLSDNVNNISRINNILEDADVSIGSDVTQLQTIVDVLIKIDAKDGDSTATDITQSEWQLIGLNNVSSPDANELNIALANVNSLDLGTTPLSNLQLMVDSLNALDQVKYGNSTGVALSDLTNIGVTGVGGVGEPSLEAVNAVLFDPDVSADHTNSVQDIVDVLVKVAEKDVDSLATDITQSEFELLGLNNLSSPDANELNIALDDADSLDLGTNPQANLQLIIDSLNALDQVKYGNSTGVALSDLTNIGVTGVGGGDEPSLEAVNLVLYDDDVSADHTNSVQEVVDALNLLNESDGTWDIAISVADLETLGIRASDGSFSNDELDYINYRIGENSAIAGDGDYRNDPLELQALVDNVDGRVINIGGTGDDIYTYVQNELFDAHIGDDTLNIEAGTTVDLSAIHDFENIILNSNNSNIDTDLGTALDEISVADVIDISDGSNVLTIDENDGVANDTVERVFLDTGATGFQTDGVLDAEGYYNYLAIDGSGVTVRIQELIIVE